MTCTARWATGDGTHRAGDLCGEPATEWVGDSDLCPHHFGRALNWFYKRKIELPKERQREHEESLRQAAEARRLAAEARSIVYFLRRGDGVIKIGFSTNYPARLNNLRGQHGPLRLLLAYAGGRREESEAHHRFAAACAGGEWFRPVLPLLLEVQRLRQGRDKRPNNLPEQAPIAEVRALIKSIREQQKAA
jgi:hypothetical protein